jgi:predicted TIM-barrel fold metal-dependent hydrolase
VFDVPPGSWDSHVHVFEPENQYPSVADPHYTLPDGPLDKLNAMADELGIAHYAIVQPSFYGTDNRCMLDALDRAGARARGVAMVHDGISQSELQAMHQRGVRALRLDMFLRREWPLADKIAYIEKCVRMTRELGWHIQFYTPGYVVRELIPFFAHLDADFVIDHMGYMLESDGLTRQDFDNLLRTLQQGKGWLKLSGPYRVAKDGNYARLIPLAQAIVAELPGRVVWGSDWPHIPNGARDTGDLLNMLADWIPDATVRKQVLADNPSRLYGLTT